jgi:DNA-binding transcriptional ArsR family regulator
MDLYFAIAEPNRRLILEYLAIHGQLAASDIADKFKITAAAISQHLKVLFEAGLIKKQKQAQKRVYTLNKEGFTELDEWMQQLRVTWDNRLDNLDRLLKTNR